MPVLPSDLRNRLVHECAYEHWHRMLFARFLSENHLLIHEKEGMPVTLDMLSAYAECYQGLVTGDLQRFTRHLWELPKPSSDNPTQWFFAGSPVASSAPLQVGVARLLGYLWPRQTGQTASGAPPVSEDGLEKFVDEDGIVCIPSVRGEQPAADRLRELLIKAYGKTWSSARQDELLAAVGFEGRTLEDWLRNEFFEQHCKFFHHRPFIWQIWDGRKDGFSALRHLRPLEAAGAAAPRLAPGPERRSAPEHPPVHGSRRAPQTPEHQVGH